MEHMGMRWRAMYDADRYAVVAVGPGTEQITVCLMNKHLPGECDGGSRTAMNIADAHNAMLAERAKKGGAA
jgi:hypothetical protein